MPESEQTRPTLSIAELYKECGASYRYHLEWRYKVMTRYLIAVSALLAVFGWMVTDGATAFHLYAWVPFLMITIVSAGFLAMSFRNKVIFDKHETVGAALEGFAETVEDRKDQPSGIYTEWIGMPMLWPPAYNVVFPLIYGLIGLASFALMCAILKYGPIVIPVQNGG